MTVVDQIKERVDIVELVSQYVPLKKVGRNYQGLCPFHNEKTPSFVVFPDSQSWHCFGACGTGGDVLSFIMRRENLTFPEALQRLAQRAGISLRPPSEREAAADRAKQLVLEINEAAAAYFHHLLLESSEGERTRAYLGRRGISLQTIQAFQLGYALDDWHATEHHLTSRGYQTADLVTAGLLIERDTGGNYDRFRGRLIFPIRDMRGRVIGFGGRVLDDGLPKYLNSPQTVVFDKSGILYGIDLARDAIRDQGLAIIVEGYMDVLMAHQHGIKNVVASLGTALTAEHLSVLKRLTKRIALALDADAAGGRGTLRGLETAQQVMDSQVLPVPTWKGLVQYETQLDAELRIITLPPGKDPDELIREDQAAWERLVQEALPVIAYYFRAMTVDLDLQSPKGKAEALNRLQPVIAAIGNPAERAHYIQELARLVKVDERTLAATMRKTERPRAASPMRKEGRFSGFPGLNLGVEKYLLFLLMHRPNLLHMTNSVLMRLALEPLQRADFGPPEYQEIFALLATRTTDESFSIADMQAYTESSEGGLYREWQEFQTHIAMLPETDLPIDAGRCAILLRKLHVEERLVELRYLSEDARRDGDAEATARWMSLITRCIQQRAQLDDALSRLTLLGYRQREAPATP